VRQSNERNPLRFPNVCVSVCVCACVRVCAVALLINRGVSYIQCTGDTVTQLLIVIVQRQQHNGWEMERGSDTAVWIDRLHCTALWSGGRTGV
jgi:hypothetical protein